MARTGVETETDLARARVISDSLEHMRQGVTVFDKDLRLVLYNQAAVDMLDLPPELPRIGLAFEDVMRFNAERGEYGPVDVEEAVRRRVEAAHRFEPHTFERVRPNGHTIEVEGTPLPGGGFITIYTDITNRRSMEVAAGRFGRILDQSANEIYIFEAEMLTFRHVNQGARVNLDYYMDDLAAMTPIDLMPDFDRDTFTSLVEPLRNGELNQLLFNTVHQRKDGSTYPVEVTLQYFSAERPPVFVSVVQDITEKRKAEEARRLADQRFALHVQQTPLAVIEWDMDFRVSEWNLAATRTFGYTRDEAIGRHAADLIVPQVARQYMDGVWGRLLERKVGDRNTAENITKSGDLIVCEWYNNPLIDATGQVIGVASIIHDITERQQAEETIWRQANFDPLTGLPNRMVFADRMEMAKLQADRDERLVALHFLDLDYFKDVNDTEGHAAGDTLLKEVAHRLRATVRKTDTVSRLGGDEFAIIQTSIKHVDAAEELARKILKSLTEPFDVGTKKVFIGGSVGVTVYPLDDRDPDELLRNADIAMYAAKGKGRNTYVFYSADMSDAIKSRQKLEQDLHKALASGQLYLDYQPKMTSADSTISGVEALLRWQHPTRGLIPPDEFIPLAEKAGLIEPLGTWVLREACRQNKEWQDRGLPPLTVAVNLSALQFRQGNLAETIENALAEFGLEACYLELEITETTAMHDAVRTADILDRLSALGVKISLDDFGTGYSSLAYLKRFPLSRIKIDKSFVADVIANADDAAIVDAVVNLGRSMNMTVTAEGVETGEQAEYLAQCGCDEFQGFHFSRPVTPEAVERLLSNAVEKKKSGAA